MYRDSFESCPRCAIELVDARSARGCRACGGLWIQEQVLTEMVLAMLPPRPLGRLVLAVIDRAGAAIRCPTCGDPMEATSIHEVILDRCAKHGIWFDAHELQQALRRVADPERAPPLQDLAERPRPLPGASGASGASTSGEVELVFQVHAPGRTPREVRVREGIIKLGRALQAHVRLDDDQVSRIHAVIDVNGPGDVELIDLGSDAGTLVNGEPIGNRKLRTGDTLQLGRTLLRVAIVPAG
jgi:Zn-finger nucleic acid-binding protein